ncbi:MAG: type IV toxin-antitoxin system AbiEi family antitoxin domain-containing protein [Methylophilus sp.]|nr:type IV toxin-antitoxin system AbiEi family antitoxin domain-containing protein [Methylophilus sp.]
MNRLAENLLDLARNKGLICPCDLAPLGIPRVSLTRAVCRGQLERVGRGLYGLPGRECQPKDRCRKCHARFPKGLSACSLPSVSTT